MDKLIYVLMTGAERSLQAQHLRANNLANAETDGFRADYEVAGSQVVPGYGFATSYQSAGTSEVVSQRPGNVRETGRDLDIALMGQGLLAVRVAEGSEAYTRAGAMQVDANGNLSVNGRPVLGDGGPIVLPAHRAVSVSVDGTISILPQDGTEMQEVNRLKLVEGDQPMTKNSFGLLVPKDGGELPASDDVRVLTGALESSNVSAVEEMVAVMDISRQFEMQMQLFKAAGSMSDSGNRLIRD